MITAGSLTDLIKARNKLAPKVPPFASIPLALASQYATALEAVRDAAELTTGLRVRQFVAQIAHETGGFRRLTENLRYSDPKRLDDLFGNVHGVDHAKRLIAEGPIAIGNCAYAWRNGNGSVESGDGWRFRGRGFLMNTGRSNYEKVQHYSGLKVVDNPDLLGQPTEAAQAAAAFWKDNHLNAAADADEADEVTRIVNGKAMEGHTARALWAEAGKSVWH